jgi:type VI secretion system secreted protein Hcp
MTGMSDMTDATGITDAVATRRALLAGALGVGTLGALAPGLAADAAAPIPTTPGDYFLRIDGIPGESLDDRHRDWIELLTFSWGVSSSVNPLTTSPGAPASKSTPVDFTFVAHTSRASPRLFLACARGTRINNVLLEVARAGAERLVFLKVNLQDVRVASFNEAPGDDGLPLDVVRLRYVKITDTYTPQSPTGGPGTPVVAGFDFAANAAL